MNSNSYISVKKQNLKNSDLVQVFMSLKKSEEILYLKTKKSYTSRKEERFLPFNHFSVYPKPVRTKTLLEMLPTIQVKWHYFAGELYELYLCQHQH